MADRISYKSDNPTYSGWGNASGWEKGLYSLLTGANAYLEERARRKAAEKEERKLEREERREEEKMRLEGKKVEIEEKKLLEKDEPDLLSADIAEIAQGAMKQLKEGISIKDLTELQRLILSKTFGTALTGGTTPKKTSSDLEYELALGYIDNVNKNISPTKEQIDAYNKVMGIKPLTPKETIEQKEADIFVSALKNLGEGKSLTKEQLDVYNKYLKVDIVTAKDIAEKELAEARKKEIEWDIEHPTPRQIPLTTEEEIAKAGAIAGATLEAKIAVEEKAAQDKYWESYGDSILKIAADEMKKNKKLTTEAAIRKAIGTWNKKNKGNMINTEEFLTIWGKKKNVKGTKDVPITETKSKSGGSTTSQYSNSFK